MPEYKLLKKDSKEIDNLQQNNVKLRLSEVSETRKDKLAKLQNYSKSATSQLHQMIADLLAIVSEQEERILALELKN